MTVCCSRPSATVRRSLFSTRRYERPVLAFFLYRVGDPELAADLTAEVFAAALASLSRYRPGRAPASAWLFGESLSTSWPKADGAGGSRIAPGGVWGWRRWC